MRLIEDGDRKKSQSRRFFIFPQVSWPFKNSCTLFRFHHLHGRNARILNVGLTASRPNALSEFNDAIVMSNRPLRDGEMFEIQIERIVERWSGSIEAGVTLIKPEELEFPNTMTDIDYDTWMLSGSAVMKVPVPCYLHSTYCSYSYLNTVFI